MIKFIDVRILVFILVFYFLGFDRVIKNFLVCIGDIVLCYEDFKYLIVKGSFFLIFLVYVVKVVNVFFIYFFGSFKEYRKFIRFYV